jgi:DsbC/DsbD-like thiol-disulfide interchange protein
VRFAFFALLLFLALAEPGVALASKNISVALLSEQAAVELGRPFTIGLRMKIRPGWHTYWKNPGDSGMPLQITWKLPEGFSAGPMQWPAPERIAENSLMSYGYSREVLIPIEITPPSDLASDSITLAGTFDWLECRDICLPGSATLRLTLPVRRGGASAGPAARDFARARSRIPAMPTNWSFTAQAGPRAILLAFREPPGLSARGAYLFVDRPLVTDYAAPQGFERTADFYRLTLQPNPNVTEKLERLTGVLVVEGRFGPGAAVQIDVPVAAGDPSPAPEQPPRARPGAALPVTLLAIIGLGMVLFLLGLIQSGRRK